MKVTRKELERIAALCKLKFTEEEYAEIQAHFERTISDCEVLFSSPDGNNDIIFPPRDEKELDYNLAFCQNRKMMS